jgi:hypothetical protein
MRHVPAISSARGGPSSSEAWVNAGRCDALAWETLTPEQREINLAIDVWVARRRRQIAKAAATVRWTPLRSMARLGDLSLVQKPLLRRLLLPR